MTDKEKRETYGVNMTPIPASRAYRKPLQHFQSTGVDAWGWMLVNDTDKIVIHVNTYNGKAGRKWKPKEIHLDDDKLQKKVKHYTEIPIGECPVATAISTPVQ